MIDARQLQNLVREYDGLRWLIEQAEVGDKLKVQQLDQGGAQGIGVLVRMRIQSLMSESLLQIAHQELDRVIAEIREMGATIGPRP